MNLDEDAMRPGVTQMKKKPHTVVKRRR